MELALPQNRQSIQWRDAGPVGSHGKKLDGHIKGDLEDKILQIRQRILRFADEMYQGIYHSKEHFEEILRQARVYELYCDENPKFENGKTAPAIELIKAQYKECLEKHSFERRNENEGSGTEETHEGDRGLSQLQVPGGMAV